MSSRLPAVRRPQGLATPAEPTLTERTEHELTHLLFFEAGARFTSGKTFEDQATSDQPEEAQIALVTAADVLEGIGLSCMVPCKGK